MIKYSKLPGEIKGNILHGHFPTDMQAFIFRMWEMVPIERLALVLETTEKKVLKAAEDMGLPPQKNLQEWMERGYITIIKNCWHILPYEQLLTLLGWDEDKLAYCLKEDDTLGMKLGGVKPLCSKILYRELSSKEKIATEKIKKIVEEYSDMYTDKVAKPFDFYTERYAPINSAYVKPSDYSIVINSEWTINTKDNDADFFVDMFIGEIKKQWGIEIKRGIGEKNIVITCDLENVPEEYHEVYIDENCVKISAADAVGILRGLTFIEDLAKTAGGMFFNKKSYKRTPLFKKRFIYSYNGLYGNVFDEDINISYSDEILYNYAKLGINGIWVMGVLYRLSEFPFDPSVSQGWHLRLRRLDELVKKAKKYGISVYMYLNEPRSMPVKFFEKHPNLKGHIDTKFFKGTAALCTGRGEVIDYIKNAVKAICNAIPDLGGFFTITSSENLTNCYSRVLNKETNCPVCKNRKPEDIICEINNAIAEGAHEVNPDIRITAWTWEWIGRNMDREEANRCIEKTDKSITVMCTSEENLSFNICGHKSTVNDYTLSRIGPSERSDHTWMVAKASGHNIAAKVQFNCTWECSTVPFIPVYGNILKYLKNLIDRGISDIMMSWTLGGYPSDNIRIASSMFFDNSDDVDVLKSLYGDFGSIVKAATDIFCEAFKEFPFAVKTLYRGPQNAGPSNLLYIKPTGYSSTMTCYSYDDLENWYEDTIYTLDTFENQWRLLCDKWKHGLRLLDGLPQCDLLDVSLACYYIFKSSRNQIMFIRARDEGRYGKLPDLIIDEKECAQNLYKVMLRNPCIGYEAANHYYYNRTHLIEKVINCEHVLSEAKKMVILQSDKNLKDKEKNYVY